MQGQIITREEARAAKLPHYFTGKMCNRQHIAKRLVVNGDCIDCVRIRGQINKERNLASGRRHYQKNKRIINARKRTYLQEYQTRNREKLTQKRKDYQLRNKEKLRAVKRLHYERNRDIYHQRMKEWRRKNPEKILQYSRNRRARKKNASGKHTAQEILRLLELQKKKCAECLCSISAFYHADHIMPLRLGGSNDIKNIQLLCEKCNHEKRAKHPLEWAREKGRLL